MRRGHLLSVDDLLDDEVDAILDEARRLRAGGSVATPPLITGLLFLSPSMRTRVGFEAATLRLGGSAIVISEPRWQHGMSAAESFDDTLRTLAGMVDTVVLRVPHALDHATLPTATVAPVVNGGDAHNHPTQALIDIAAIEAERGPVADLRIGMCGDLSMRAARSLIELATRRKVREIVLIAPETRRGPQAPSPGVTYRAPGEWDDLDVLYMVGLPEGSGQDVLDDAARAAYRLTASGIRRLPDEAIVLSPLPVIDEIDAEARSDPRVRMFAASDRSVFVRMAILEHVLGGLA